MRGKRAESGGFGKKNPESIKKAELGFIEGENQKDNGAGGV